MPRIPKTRIRLAEPNPDNVERAGQFPKYYASNVYCSLTPVDFRIQFLNEKLKYSDGWFYVADGMAILSPRAAKRLHEFLGKALKTYEAQHGVIETKITEEEPY